jgi:hypothetical protein
MINYIYLFDGSCIDLDVQVGLILLLIDIRLETSLNSAAIQLGLEAVLGKAVVNGLFEGV